MNSLSLSTLSVSRTIRQVLKHLCQLLHGLYGLCLHLQSGQFPQELTATQGTKHRLSSLTDEREREKKERKTYGLLFSF